VIQQRAVRRTTFNPACHALSDQIGDRPRKKSTKPIIEITQLLNVSARPPEKVRRNSGPAHVAQPVKARGEASVREFRVRSNDVDTNRHRNATTILMSDLVSTARSSDGQRTRVIVSPHVTLSPVAARRRSLY